MSKLEDALKFLEAGLNIIPIEFGKKAPPLIKKWKHLQTEKITEQELSRLMGDRECNLGIVTGDISKIIVVDCDNELVVEWALANLPKTFTVKTARGCHFYYRAPNYRVKTQTNKKNVAPGVKIDIKGDGGYVVAPDSYNRSEDTYYVSDEELSYELLAGLPQFSEDWFNSAETITNIEKRGTVSRKSSRLKKAEEFISFYPPAIEGENGEPHTYELARKLLWDYRVLASI